MKDEDENETCEVELTDDEKALLDEMPALEDVGVTRRSFLVAGGLGAFALNLLEVEAAFAALAPAQDAVVAAGPAAQNTVRVTLRVNGVMKTLDLDSRVVLLDALRERLALTGSKKGCDQGQCGACTVLVDGKRVLSCLTLTATLEGRASRSRDGEALDGQRHRSRAALDGTAGALVAIGSATLSVQCALSAVAHHGMHD